MTTRVYTRISPFGGHATTVRQSPWVFLRNLMSLRKQRMDLDKLDQRLLDDVGIPAEDARLEAKRPFWDAPGTWLR